MHTPGKSREDVLDEEMVDFQGKGQWFCVMLFLCSLFVLSHIEELQNNAAKLGNIATVCSLFKTVFYVLSSKATVWFLVSMPRNEISAGSFLIDKAPQHKA
jgi:hypothetical protein